MHLLRLLITIIAIAIVDAAVSSVPVAPQQSVHPLAAWVLTTGKEIPLRKNIALIMGVATEDIIVIERGFRTLGDDTTHVVGVRRGGGPGGIDLFFFARVVEDQGSGTIWKCSPTGDLEISIRIDPEDGVNLLSNKEQLGEFLSEKEYFRRKMLEGGTDRL